VRPRGRRRRGDGPADGKKFSIDARVTYGVIDWRLYTRLGLMKEQSSRHQKYQIACDSEGFYQSSRSQMNINAKLEVIRQYGTQQSN
jgi:hypothetical protein